jgi:hypothetical protein
VTQIPTLTAPLWAHFRFSVVGTLLSSPPAQGELKGTIESLAATTWIHPVSEGDPKRGHRYRVPGQVHRPGAGPGLLGRGCAPYGTRASRGHGPTSGSRSGWCRNPRDHGHDSLARLRSARNSWRRSSGFGYAISPKFSKCWRFQVLTVGLITDDSSRSSKMTRAWNLHVIVCIGPVCPPFWRLAVLDKE